MSDKSIFDRRQASTDSIMFISGEHAHRMIVRQDTMGKRIKFDVPALCKAADSDGILEEGSAKVVRIDKDSREVVLSRYFLYACDHVINVHQTYVFFKSGLLVPQLVESKFGHNAGSALIWILTNSRQKLVSISRLKGNCGCVDEVARGIDTSVKQIEISIIQSQQAIARCEQNIRAYKDLKLFVKDVEIAGDVLS